MLLARGACERVVVLAVETVEECADLFARGRWLTRRPLVEAAVAVLLTREGGEDVDRAGGDAAPAHRVPARRGDARLRSADRPRALPRGGRTPAESHRADGEGG